MPIRNSLPRSQSRFVEMFSNERQHYRLNEVCKIITDGTHQPPEFVSCGIPFIFVSNIVNNEISYNTEKYITQETYNSLIVRTPIEMGDIILSTVGSYGHPAVVKNNKKFLFQRHIAYLKPKHEIVDSDFLHSALLSSNVQQQIDRQVKGIAQKTLNLSAIKQLVVPIPKILEQRKFARLKNHIDKSKLAVQKSLEELETLKNSLMQQYFD
jgi:type I restriction enzyme S subunit